MPALYTLNYPKCRILLNCERSDIVENMVIKLCVYWWAVYFTTGMVMALSTSIKCSAFAEYALVKEKRDAGDDEFSDAR